MKQAGRVLGLSLCGLAAGMVNGLLGAGSGVVLVWALRRVLGDKRQSARDIFANATAIILPISLFSLLSYGRADALPSSAALAPYILPGAVGGLLGAWLLGRLPETLVQRIFGAVVLASGVIMLLR